jgi:hypothetical protein
MVPVCPPKKREYLIVQHVPDRRAQPGRHEGKLSLFSECVLDGGGELPKLADLVLVDLVERYQDAGAIFGKEVREQLDLATEAGFGTFKPANEAIQRLVEASILRQITIGRRNRAFEAPEVVDAFTALERQLASASGDTRTSTPVRRVPRSR